jgi:iron-sulfur cluster repair protein YtfE (RIC family)
MPEGEVAAPDGIHELSDGTLVETAGGLVVNIEAAGDQKKEEEEMYDNEFTSEMLTEMIDKAMAKYAESFAASLELMKSENEKLKAELAEVKNNKEEIKKEFSNTLNKVAEDLEELAKSEPSTASKPSEFKAMTRAERAARMGAIIRANKK